MPPQTATLHRPLIREQTAKVTRQCNYKKHAKNPDGTLRTVFLQGDFPTSTRVSTEVDSTSLEPFGNNGKNHTKLQQEFVQPEAEE